MQHIKVHELLYRIHATDRTNRRAWYYLQVSPEKLSKFKMKLLTGNLIMSDYGHVVASGYGEQVPAHIQAEIQAIKPEFLNGEREIINGNIQLCLDQPKNVTTRILLAKTLLAMKNVRADLLPEFREKVALLQKQHSLSEHAQVVVQKMFDEAFS